MLKKVNEEKISYVKNYLEDDNRVVVDFNGETLRFSDNNEIFYAFCLSQMPKYDSFKNYFLCVKGRHYASRSENKRVLFFDKEEGKNSC